MNDFLQLSMIYHLSNSEDLPTESHVLIMDNVPFFLKDVNPLFCLGKTDLGFLAVLLKFLKDLFPKFLTDFKRNFCLGKTVLIIFVGFLKVKELLT